MPRQGMTAALEARTRAADPTVKSYIELLTITQGQFKRTLADWSDADSTTGFRIDDDGGVRLSTTITTQIATTVGAGKFGDLDRISPYRVAVVAWRGNDNGDFEIHRIRSRVDPGNPTDVHTWRLIVWAIVERREGYLGATPAYFIGPSVESDVLNVGATAPFDITFDFTDQLPRPARWPVWDYDDSDDAGDDPAVFSPMSIIQLVALKSDGTAATTGEWFIATGDVSLNGNTLEGRTMVDLADAAGGRALGVYRFTAQNTAPHLIVETSSFTGGTLTFTTNPLVLPAAPTAGTILELTAYAEQPRDTTVVFEINDGVAGWTPFVDGDDIDSLGLIRQTSYDVRIIFTATKNVSPTLRELGIQEIKINDVTDVADFRGGGQSFDPLTLKASIPTAELIVARDGYLDFRAAIDDLMVGNYIGNILVRRFIGADDLLRSEFMLHSIWLIEDYELAGGDVFVSLFSPMKDVRRKLPKYNTQTLKRESLKYENSSLKATWTDLVVNQLEIPGRYVGPGVEDDTIDVSKIIRDSDGKDEVDAISFLDGSITIFSQGALRAVKVFRDAQVPPAFIFGLEDLEPISITPGFRFRTPVFYTPFDYLEAEDRFDKEIRRFHGPSIINLGQGSLDAIETLQAETSKWFQVQSHASAIGQRTVNSLGTGLILWAFRSPYAFPELQLGDVVLSWTDRFLARDPNTGRGLVGALYARAVVQDIRDEWGRDFTLWIQSYADILSSFDVADRESLDADPEIVNFVADLSGIGEVSAHVKTKNALSVKVASSIVAAPTRGDVQGEASVAVDAEGNLATGVIRSLSEGEKLYLAVLAYETTTGGGQESVDMVSIESDERETTIFGDVDVTDGFSASRNAAAPENGNVILTIHGSFAYSNLEDANSNLTTYRAFVDINWNDGGTLVEPAEVNLYVSSAATGGTWSLEDGVGGDGESGIDTDVELQATVAIDADFDLRIELVYSNPGVDGGKTTVTVHGEDNAQPGVEFKKKGVRISATRVVLPVGVDKWQVE